MGLPFRIPSYIAKEAMKQAVEIECYNFCTECLGGILVDDEYWLEGHEASSSFFLIPKDAGRCIPYSIASFYADCLAFEHDFSTLAIPPLDDITDLDVPWNFKPKLVKSNEYSLKHMYINKIREAVGIASDVSNDPWGKAVFKYDWLETSREDWNGHQVVKVKWFPVFAGVSKAIHLYNAALRQNDPLYQYLCYYRVIENIAGNNGKVWVEDKISNSDMECSTPIWYEIHHYGTIPQELEAFVRMNIVYGSNQQVNITEVLRASALFQLDELRKYHSDHDIARRLYNENRCGIAHGDQIKSHDLGDDFRSILNDLKLLKFLARLAVSECLPG